MEEKEINPIEETIDKDEEIRIVNELANINGLPEYLRAIMARDLNLHFTCKKEEQDLVRGGYFRTKWLLKKIREAEAKLTKVK